MGGGVEYRTTKGLIGLSSDVTLQVWFKAAAFCLNDKKWNKMCTRARFCQVVQLAKQGTNLMQTSVGMCLAQTVRSWLAPLNSSFFYLD